MTASKVEIDIYLFFQISLRRNLTLQSSQTVDGDFSIISTTGGIQIITLNSIRNTQII